MDFKLLLSPLETAFGVSRSLCWCVAPTFFLAGVRDSVPASVLFLQQSRSGCLWHWALDCINDLIQDSMIRKGQAWFYSASRGDAGMQKSRKERGKKDLNSNLPP